MTTQLQHPDLAPQQPQARSPFPAEIANFNLLTARNRTNERAPHYFGSFKSAVDGQWYQVSMWIQYARNSGEQMLNQSIRPCTPEEAARHEERDRQFQQNRTQGNAPTTSNPLHGGPTQANWGAVTAGAPDANPLDQQHVEQPATDKPPF